MKIGQTSFVVFVSKILGSAIGFLATLYFARKLGAEVIGIFALILTIVRWLMISGQLGIAKALEKRLSEGKQRGEFLSAGILLVLSLTIVISIGIVLAEPLLDQYVGEFDQYVDVSIIWPIIAILVVRLFYRSVQWTLGGERKVYLKGILQPISIGATSLIQVLLVVAALGLMGMILGYVIGSILVGLFGLYWVSTRPARPGKQHFLSLFDFAKYSWLGSLKSRAFNQVDVLLLGVFVPSALVGVYTIAWTIAKFLELFSTAISSTMFPEISYNSAQNADQSVAGLVEDALAYTGLIAIPGLVGGFILAERLLRLYGDEFTQGAAVLGILILAILVYSYQAQLMNTLNGIDRPDIAFRINVTFILINAVLNLILIPQFGIEGAAIATALSAIFGFGLAFRAVSRLIDFQPPLGEPTRQVVAAAVMGGIVWGVLRWIEYTGQFQYNAIIVTVLVSCGALIYFLILLVISTRFRETVDRNLPVRIPYLQ